MKVLIGHLSDIHLQHGKPNPVLDRAEKLADVLLSLAGVDSAIVMVVTGDIAYSGTAGDYELAREFFDTIHHRLQQRTELKPTWIFLPGNHDCDFSRPDLSTRDLMLAGLAAQRDLSELPDDAVMHVTAHQTTYFDLFESHVSGETASRLIRSHQLELGDIAIVVRTMNSAWLSQLHEQQGTIRFPYKLLAASEGDLVISAMHHPLNWFEPANSRAVSDVLEQTSDLILTGHQHDPADFRKIRATSQTQFIEAGVLQVTGNPQHSTFGCVVVDTERRTYRHYPVRWSGGIYRPSDPSPESEFRRKIPGTHSDFSISPSWSTYLADCGAHYTHPHQTTIRVEDIFVCPDFRDLGPLAGPSRSANRIIQDINPLLQAGGKFILSGGDLSGKTTLAKVMFKRSLEAGKLPVILTGSDISSNDDQKFRDLVSAALKHEYDQLDQDRYFQLPSDKRVVLVDDWQACPLNTKGRNALAAIVCHLANTVVLIGGEPIGMESVSEVSQHADCLIDFRRLEILPLGHVKRHELAKKWHSLGRETRVQSRELEVRVAETERVFDSICCVASPTAGACRTGCILDGRGC